MKGIRLFIRPSTPDDQPRLRSFWEAENRESSPELTNALIGFLLGEVSAWLAWERDRETLRIRDLWVARNLRRKRIARTMLAELDAEARRLGSVRLAVRPSSEFVEAFRRLGFTKEADGTLVRPVERVC